MDEDFLKDPSAIEPWVMLVYALHPDLRIVRRILREAAQQVDVIQVPPQQARPVTGRPSKAGLSLGELLQVSIFAVSERWERDQERVFNSASAQRPELKPCYRPSPQVMGMRFLKRLVYQTYLLSSYHLALALGCCCYTYQPSEVADVTDLGWDPKDPTQRRQNLRRSKWRTLASLHQRFAPVLTFTAGGFQDRCPTAEDRALVDEALPLLRPWGTAHFAAHAQPVSALLSADLPERQWQHALLCTTCAGFAQLVRDWNALLAKEKQLAAPETTLRIPVFTLPPSHDPGSGPHPPGPDLFDPAITDDDLEDLRLEMVEALSAASQRRRRQAFHRYRLCLDGDEQAQWTDEPSVSLTFRLPLTTLRVEVLGEDDTGELVLSVLYVPALDHDLAPELLYHVSEGGATVLLRIAPASPGDDDSMTRDATVEFWAEEARVPKNRAWYEAARATAARSLDLATVTGDTVGAARLRKRLEALQHAEAGTPLDTVSSPWAQRLRRGIGQFTGARRADGGSSWRYPALAALLLVSLGVHIWLGVPGRGPSPQGLPSLVRPSTVPATQDVMPIARFQETIRSTTGLGPLVTAHSALNAAPSLLGFTPPAPRTLAFRLGTGYAEALAYLRSGDLPHAAQHLVLLMPVVAALETSPTVAGYLEVVHTLIQQHQQTPEVLTAFLALLEPVIMEAYARTPDRQGSLWFQTGGWLVNLAMAAAAADRTALQQGAILGAVLGAIPQRGVPQQVPPQLEALRALLARPTLTDDDLAAVLSHVQALQQLLAT